MLNMGDDDKLYLTGARPPSRDGRTPLRIADLFSGCGGLTLGVLEAARQLGRCGKVSLAVEADPHIAAAYAANFAPQNGTKASRVEDWFDHPATHALSSRERSTRTTVGQVDILVGGPPCQGHSTLNNHTRGQDPKNALYLVMVRAAQVLEPSIVIVENVPALANDADRVLDEAIEGFEHLGYKVDHRVVSIADIGVPQLRKRHVLIASKRAPNIKAAIEPSRISPWRTLKWAIHDLLDAKNEHLLDQPSVLSEKNASRATYLLDNDLYDLPNMLRPQCQQGAHRYKSMYGRMSWDAPAQTITTGFGSPGQGRYLHPEHRRTLTPHEAARIQFLPDWYDFSAIPHRGGLSVAIGNAVPPKLGFVLAHHALQPLKASAKLRQIATQFTAEAS